MNIQTIGTHNGKFHSDDVFSVALLTTLFPDAVVTRSRDQSVLDTLDLVLDVGGEYDISKNRFDHHQVGGAGDRPNGIRYSAFGLIWQAYGLEYCQRNEEAHKRLFEGFVSSFDAYDNGHNTFEITTVDASVVQLQDIFDKYLNPNSSEPCELEDYDRAFASAVEMAKIILDRVVRRQITKVKSEQDFFSQWQQSPDKRFVVLDVHCSAGDMAEKMPELLYYVYQAPNKNWHVQAMTKDKGTFDTKKPLPVGWAGLKDSEFADYTGVADAIFCHNNLHLCGAGSKEGALKLLELALA